MKRKRAREARVYGGPFLFHDFPGYTLKMMEDHLLRVRVRFNRGARVSWKVDLGKLIKT